MAPFHKTVFVNLLKVNVAIEINWSMGCERKWCVQYMGYTWIVPLKGKGMPSTAFFAPLCWNVIVKPGAGAALLDHEIEVIHIGWQSNQIEEPGAPDGCQVVILACPEMCRTGE